MWRDSKAWRLRYKIDKKEAVKFDVFCGQCQKQLGRDVAADQISLCGIQTQQPMDVFCGQDCMKAYESSTGKTLWFYGHTRAVQ